MGDWPGRRTRAALVVVGTGLSLAAAPPLPPDLLRQLPPGYHVLAGARLAAGRPLRTFRIVALGRTGERAAAADTAPPRPLLIFEQRGGRFVPVGRNDHVVFKADEGGQCDPFLDDGGTIAVAGRFFTVENGVSCGQHWSVFVTFRLTDGHGFVFDNQRTEYWQLNNSDDPGADALVRRGPQRVRRDPPGRFTPFAAWRPRY